MRLVLSSICKSFFGNAVLKNVNFEVRDGEIHALAGLNGAGKSTLVSILSGASMPDSGEIYCDGEAVCIKNPAAAMEKGIFTFYQAVKFLPDLSVAENIFMPNAPTKFGFLDYRNMFSMAEELFRELDYHIDVRKKVKELNIGQIYMMSLARAFHSGAGLFILDEPMINLTRQEKSKLAEFMLRMRDLGKSVIFITHNTAEVLNLSDRITVLRDGRNIAVCETNGLAPERLNGLISGNYALRLYPPKNKPGEEVLLEANDIFSMSVRGVSLRLHQGEILGITGLTGAGGTSLIRSIFGDIELESGSIFLNGNELHLKNACDALGHKFGYISEDREDGLFMDMGVAANMTITALDTIRNGVFLDLQQEQNDVVDQSIELNLEFNSLSQEIRCLSGGNQQKVLVGRSLLSNANVLLLDEPTQGIDIVSRSEIYIILHELAASGKGIIITSADMEELTGLCNRVIVLQEGQLIAEVREPEFPALHTYF